MQSNTLFTSSPSVRSSRILYTPTPFARTSLLHLQEVGILQALKPHTSKREKLQSYLCFVVENGEGELVYEGEKYELTAGDVVFIDCRKPYSHSTGTNLWALQWCHFCGSSLVGIHAKYLERGGQPVFTPADVVPFCQICQQLYDIAGSSDHIRDMKINEKLNSLLTLIMQESWHPKEQHEGRKRRNCIDVKNYLDEHFAERITLEELSATFYMDKYYLTKCFKEEYGVTINQYLLQMRITKAKQMLRFTDEKLETIGLECGIGTANYFSRTFKKIEGISPSEYREMW